MTDKRELRRQLRANRRSLSRAAQKQAALGLQHQLAQIRDFRNATRIAAYWPFDGEIDPRPALLKSIQHGKQVYLPQLHPFSHGHLLFQQWHTHTHLEHNRYGISEVANATTLPGQPLWTLDLILLPLVGFDSSGARLGMGGGYYDRTLAALAQPRPRQPRLLGIAHDCQRVATLPVASWDIRLDGIVTATTRFKI